MSDPDEAFRRCEDAHLPEWRADARHTRLDGGIGGWLPPEVIQAIVRGHFGSFRLCYENGLRASPNLNGRVSLKFVIGVDGTVSNVADARSDLPDPSVIGCILDGAKKLRFPKPEGGIVTVVYPIIFSPGDE